MPAIAKTNGTKAKVSVGSPLKKAPTGIFGLDEVTRGGLPQGRATLVCGGPGCGKTMLGVEFLVRGATQFDEPGVCIAFEESPEEIAQNVRSLGLDLNDLVARKKLFLDAVEFDRAQIQETGEYDLEALFLRLRDAIETVGARRVLLDTLEALFSSFGNQAILRAEIRRIFRWLKDRGVTTVITAERGTDTLTRHGLEEYVSDCVILLDHRVQDEVSTRRLRVVKYRGSYHGTNEYPFLIDESGISVLPVTSFGLQHRVGTQRLSTGIADLDEMLEGKGYFRGSTVLVSGTAGSGKTTIATHFINAACARGERCLYLSLEESPSQIVRNVTSVGVKLGPAIDKGLLLIQGTRPTEFGLEMHLMRFHKILAEFKPRAVVVDPITNLGATAGEFKEIRSMLMRLIDYLKSQQITALFTSLTSGGHDAEQSEVGVSSLIDTWLLLRELESSGERNRILYIVKSRGMAHSNQVREFVMTSQGVKLVPVYLGTSGVLTGSARIAQEAREREEKFTRELETRQYREQLERKRQALEARIAALRAEFAAEEREVARTIELQREREQRFVDDRSAMARSRRAPSDKHGKNGRLAAAGGDY